MTSVNVSTSEEKMAQLAAALRVLDEPAPATATDDERRAWERVPFRFRLTVTWTDDLRRAHANNGRGCNICYGGISLVQHEPLVRGQKVTLLLPQPDGDSRLMHARVVYCRPVGDKHEAGMQFIRDEE